MKGWQFFAVSLLALSAGYGLQYFTQGPQLDIQKLAVAPAEDLDPANLSFVDLEQQTQSLEQWRGEVLLVNYWATWCPPCRREIPALQQLQAQYGERGVKVIGIAVDKAAAVSAYVEKHEIAYPILLDSSGKTATAFGNKYGSLPFSVLLDRDLKPAKQHVGELDLSQMKAMVEPYL